MNSKTSSLISLTGVVAIVLSTMGCGSSEFAGNSHKSQAADGAKKSSRGRDEDGANKAGNSDQRDGERASATDSGRSDDQLNDNTNDHSTDKSASSENGITSAQDETKVQGGDITLGEDSLINMATPGKKYRQFRIVFDSLRSVGFGAAGYIREIEFKLTITNNSVKRAFFRN